MKPFNQNLTRLEVYDTPPEEFNPLVEAAGCYIESHGRLLLLQSSAEKKEFAGQWGVPAGKLEINETPQQAACRELFEETGISLANIPVRSLGPLYIRKPGLDYVFHLFEITLSMQPDICLSSEHQNYLWVTPCQMPHLPLLDGAKEAIEKYMLRKDPSRWK